MLMLATLNNPPSEETILLSVTVRKVTCESYFEKESFRYTKSDLKDVIFGQKKDLKRCALHGFY